MVPPPSDLPLVLFVCTGNVFRSLTAEVTVRHALGPGSRLAIGSAGTVANPQPVRPEMAERLAPLGLEAARHRPTRIDAALARRAAMVVAMGLDHRDELRSRFGIEPVLFAELAWGRSEGVLDVHEALPPDRLDRASVHDYVVQTVEQLAAVAPTVARVLVRRLVPAGAD